MLTFLETWQYGSLIQCNTSKTLEKSSQNSEPRESCYRRTVSRTSKKSPISYILGSKNPTMMDTTSVLRGVTCVWEQRFELHYQQTKCIMTLTLDMSYSSMCTKPKNCDKMDMMQTWRFMFGRTRAACMFDLSRTMRISAQQVAFLVCATCDFCLVKVLRILLWLAIIIWIILSRLRLRQSTSEQQSENKNCPYSIQHHFCEFPQVFLSALLFCKYNDVLIYACDVFVRSSVL